MLSGFGKSKSLSSKQKPIILIWQMISTQNDSFHTNPIMLANLTYQINNDTTFLCFTSPLVQYQSTKESNPTLCILSVCGPGLSLRFASSGYMQLVHWKRKRSVSSPGCQLKPAGLSLNQPLSPFENNLCQNSPIKGCSSPRWDLIQPVVPHQP